MKTISTRDAVAALLENCLLENCLNFRVQVTLEEAADLLTLVSYNDIPQNLASLPADLKEMLGPIAFGTLTTGRDNPNNGRFDNLKISIGNENSLVVYISSNLFYRKGDTVARHKAALETLGERYLADEVDVTVEGNIVSARLWWD